MDGAVVDGTLWVAGGLAKSSNATDKVEGYDPVINSWKAAPPMPVRLHHHMAVTYRGELVVMGGWIPQGLDQSALLSERVFALREGRWTQLPPLLEPRAAGAATVVDDKIVVFGGQDEGRLLRSTEVFDGEKWTAGAPIPTPREHLAAASDGEFAYAVGGRVLGPDQNLDAFERYDPREDTWEPLPDMPTSRGGLGATIVRGTLFAVGGESSTNAMGDVEAYNIEREFWRRQTPMRTPRHGLVVKAIGGAFYSVGGATKPGHASAVDDVEVSRTTR
jgi:non-specific serine/threonine protein kinase